MNNNTAMKLTRIPIIGMSILLLLPFSGSGAPPTTRQQTILPRFLPSDTPQVAPSNVAQYATYGYSAWDVGSGTNEGRKLTMMPAGYTGSANAARLLSFFSISDIHITDKESPVQVPFMGWSAAFGVPGPGGLNINSYSPVIFDTTFHLDAAVKTINALHQVTPFNFGISLGDDANSSQYNELRWFIDVMDGQYIIPSSGAHLGATNIDYQMPYKAAGLDRSIPWYEAIGNHDQYWMGIGYPDDKVRSTMVSTNVLNISSNGPLVPPGVDGTGMYVGVVDGTTPYGTVIKWGLTNLFATPPTVAADTNRLSVTLDNSSPTTYITQFFNTVSSPKGHGFNLATNGGSLAACYTFEPLANMPIKMIVLDDTCKSNLQGQITTFYGCGWIDVARTAWLTNELQKGQDAGQLMIIATHIPILPQAGLFNPTNISMFYDSQSESNLVATLHTYPNLLMVMAGHRHANVVTPFPSPEPAHPEYGFWEVETPSLRDFPRQLRTWEILRNFDNTISILTTDVDPQVESNSPAWKSLGYAVASARICGVNPLSDTSSHTYNAELVKKLTPAMQAKIARYGAPLHYVAEDFDGDRLADPYTVINSSWYVWFSGSNYQMFGPIPLGVSGTPVTADFDGDSLADFAMVSSTGIWRIWFSGLNYQMLDPIPLNASGIPVAADFDGDRKADFAMVSGTGVWRIWFSGSGYQPLDPIPLNVSGIPVAADFDADGLADFAMVSSTGVWCIWFSGAGYQMLDPIPLNMSGTPVAADFDADGLADFSMVNSAGNWYIWFSGAGYQMFGPIPLNM